MDKADYLQKIATKPTPKADTSKGIFSPFLIKLLITAGAVLTLIIALGVVISNVNAKSTARYEVLYLRLQNLSADNGPLATYAKNLRSPGLRAITATLKSSLSTTYQNFSGIASKINVNPKKISQTATNEESAALTEYTTTLQNAKLNGLLDRTFVTSTILQISRILAVENELLEKTSSDSVREVLTRSISDLNLVYESFQQFSNNSN